MDCNYYHYALQLSMYSLLLEANYDIKPEDLIIVQLKEGGYEDYQLPNMKKVVIDMLNSRLAQDMS
jgi:hypothetical protein